MKKETKIILGIIVALCGIVLSVMVLKYGEDTKVNEKETTTKIIEETKEQETTSNGIVIEDKDPYGDGWSPIK